MGRVTGKGPDKASKPLNTELDPTPALYQKPDLCRSKITDRTRKVPVPALGKGRIEVGYEEVIQPKDNGVLGRKDYFGLFLLFYFLLPFLCLDIDLSDIGSVQVASCCHLLSV
ncbi:hypothetical protein CEXT_177611 [Caerostris extrusa]|uniref:Uncharacterized protein n=1 Tax=Caerostris extrusa TaxID=172846 RepID=A0AAV4WMC9_CAEEX|nr:hypothetical protein CEXT_177611 [Caerostris extrusa]